MAIKYTSRIEENLIVVTASGFDENLEEVMQYGMAVIDACKKSNCTRVLCDETNLEYRLSTMGTFQSAEFIASQVPAVAKAAIVCNERFIKDAEFWETVAVNRGLTVRVFKEVDAARRWLAES